MFRQQNNKTKGYYLEDLEDSKLIMSQNVQFFEDNSSSELAIVNINTLAVFVDIMNKFVNNALTKDKNIIIRFQPESTYNIPSFPINYVDTDNVSPNNYSVISFSKNTSRILFSPPLALKKSLKWIDLLKRNVSDYVYKPIEQYKLIIINNTIIASKLVNFAFITVANEPRTYIKALCSSYSTEQECTIKSEYFQLLKAGIFEQVNRLPTEKKAIES